MYGTSNSQWSYNLKKLFLQYPNNPLPICSVPDGEGLNIPKVLESFLVESSEEESKEAYEPTALHDPDYLPSTSAELHLLTQMELGSGFSKEQGRGFRFKTTAVESPVK